MQDIGATETDLGRIRQAIRALIRGRNNASGQVTLAVSPATTTTVNAVNCSAQSVPFLSPLTASAQASGAYVSVIGNGSFTITHPASTATDRTFGWACLGG